MAACHAVELYLLHALSSLPFQAFKRLLVDTPLETEQRLYNQAEAALQKKKAEILASNGIDVKYHVAIGRAHVEINRYVESHWADLIVIGKRGETELDEALFGSVTKHVLYEAPSDVVVVSPETSMGETSARFRMTAILRWCSAHLCGIYDHSDH